MAFVARTLGLTLVHRDISGELEASFGDGGGRGGQGEEGKSELHLGRYGKRAEVCEEARLKLLVFENDLPSSLTRDDLLIPLTPTHPSESREQATGILLQQ